MVFFLRIPPGGEVDPLSIELPIKVVKVSEIILTDLRSSGRDLIDEDISELLRNHGVIDALVV